MTLDLGDEAAADTTVTVPLPCNSSGSAGDAVKWDSSNDRVTPTTAAQDDVVGVLKEDSPSSAGDPASVHVHGPVVVNAGGSVVHGDVLDTSGSTNGRLVQNSDSTGKATDVDGTTDRGIFAPANPEAYSDSGGSWPPQSGNSLGTNEAVVMLH